jgi:heptosyltransferase-2
LSSALIVGPAWVGDMIMAQSLFKRLKSQKPDMQIDVLAPKASLALTNRMTEVSESIQFDVGHGELGLSYRRSLARQISKRGYEEAIVLPNSLKSALVPFFANIPKRTGFRGEYRYGLINDMRLLDKRRMPRMIDRFVALAKPGDGLPGASEFPSLTVDSERRGLLVEALRLETSRPLVGLCPGAEFGDAKRWPERHFAALAESLVDAGADVWIFGGNGDKGTAEEILKLVPRPVREHVLDLTGKTALLDVVDIMGLCKCVVSNDSGLMHVASAIGCHTIVLYGSTSPEFTPPLTTKVDTVNLSLECSPCFKRSCPLGHKNCLNDLFPVQVDRLVSKVIGTE